MRLARPRRLSDPKGEDHPRLLDRERSQSTYIPPREWGASMDRRDSSSARARALEQMMAAADDAPMMIICYSRDDATISYVNKEVYRVLGRGISSGTPVESILDDKFLAERSVDSCRRLFGIGEMVENKKSAVELRSAAGNTLPAMLVMRAAANGRDCTATLFPGNSFQADFLEWQTAKTYRAAPSRAQAPGLSISDIGTTANIGQAVKPIFVEMDTLRKVTVDDKVEWREFAHWRDGLQQSVAKTKDGEMQFGRAHLSTVKFHDFLLLRKLITRGTVMIDLEVPADCSANAALNFIASAIVEDMISSGALDYENRDEAMQVVQAQHQHATERRKRKLVDELLGPRQSKLSSTGNRSGTHPELVDLVASQHGSGAGAAAGVPLSESDNSANGGHGAQQAAGGIGPAGTMPPAVEPPSLSSGSKVSFAKQPMVKRSSSRELHAAQFAELREARDEACDVLAGTVSFLDEQAAVFVRLKRAVDLGQITEREEGVKPPPVRFVFLVLGPPDKERDNQHVGHAIACMMSNRDFASKAQVLASKDDLLETIDGSIDQTNLTFAQNIAAMRARETAEADLDEWACCGQSCFFRRGDDAFTISMDGFGGGGGNGKRSGYSAVTIVEVAVSSVPALSSVYEVKHFERPQHVRRLRRHDVPGAMLVLCGAAFVAMVLMFWVPVQPRDDVLHSRMHKLQASISSPLYLTSRAQPLLLALADNGLDAVVDVRLLAPCLDLDCGAELAAPDGRSNTRRFRRLRKSPAQLAEERRSVHASTSQRYEDATWVEWALEAGGATCASRRLALAELEQTEAFATVDVRTSGCAAEVAAGALFQLRVSTDAPGGLPVMAQAIKMGPIGRARVGLASALLGLLFVALHFEWMHRVYSTFVAAILALGLLSLTRNLPPMAVVVGFVDSGTIMLTFAMSVNVHLLALTGFFDWVTAKMVELSGGSVRRLFFLLTNMTGVLSALLDNVVVVLLLGPITIKLCEQLGVNPLPLYLTQTLAATLGGTATLLGDPLNVMLGSKLGLSFADFIIFNAPLMIVAMPAATAVQYYRMRHTLGAERVSINVAQLRFENRIYDERSLLFLAAIFVGIFLGLILTHFHGYEGAWFCALGMLGAAITTSRYDIRHAMGAVEWDALLFFCALFVFVGALEELGLIRDISSAFASWINRLPAESQEGVALLVVLWVSAIGSAFLESLAYTMVIAYVLNSMFNEGSIEVPVRPLMWALSLGACLGGIGSLKGSSANLACVGVSERFSPSNPIKGEHFLRYGFPLLLAIVSAGSLYQYVIFVHIAAGGEGYV